MCEYIILKGWLVVHHKPTLEIEVSKMTRINIYLLNDSLQPARLNLYKRDGPTDCHEYFYNIHTRISSSNQRPSKTRLTNFFFLAKEDL